MNPSLSAKIIHNCDKELKAIMTYMFVRSPNIYTNKIKMMICDISAFWNKICLLFGFKTNITRFNERMNRMINMR